jgi:hypothetical protein
VPPPTQHYVASSSRRPCSAVGPCSRFQLVDRVCPMDEFHCDRFAQKLQPVRFAGFRFRGTPLSTLRSIDSRSQKQFNHHSDVPRMQISCHITTFLAGLTWAHPNHFCCLYVANHRNCRNLIVWLIDCRIDVRGAGWAVRHFSHDCLFESVTGILQPRRSHMPSNQRTE